MGFSTTFFNVLLVLIYAIPGFILVKVKKGSVEHLKTLAAILLYVLSPCMIINAFQQIDRSKDMAINMVIFTAITFLLQTLMIILAFIIAFFVNKKLNDESKLKRLGLVGTALGNVGFFGLPIIRSLLADYPEAQVYSTLFVLSMNLLIFTVGAFAVTGDKKYISIKSLILNPTTISVVVASILFALDFKISNNFKSFGPLLSDGIEILGKATTPVSMIILGMRLASSSLIRVFTNIRAYVVTICKMVLFPIMCYLIVYFTPLDYSMRASIVILASAPCASVLLNLSELLGSEQEYAANVVLISTLSSIICMPLVLLIL